MKQYRSNGLGDNVIVIKRNETFMEDTRFISYIKLFGDEWRCLFVWTLSNKLT